MRTIFSNLKLHIFVIYYRLYGSIVYIKDGQTDCMDRLYEMNNWICLCPNENGTKQLFISTEQHIIYSKPQNQIQTAYRDSPSFKINNDW